jgi:hypothetical protein
MEKLDLRKQYKHLYLPSAKQVAIVDVPAFKFAMIDGAIEPGASPGMSTSFQQALEALYGITYTLKFASKLHKENPIDYTIMTLEALWWVEDGEFDITRPENWKWTAMIMQPDHISDSMYKESLEQLRKKRPNPSLDKMRFETFREGLSIQIMHIGPYTEEPVSLAKMDAYAQDNGFRLRGKHHEIYLGDPRRADPAKLKTVLRHPVEKISP